MHPLPSGCHWDELEDSEEDLDRGVVDGATVCGKLWVAMHIWMLYERFCRGTICLLRLTPASVCV